MSGLKQRILATAVMAGLAIGFVGIGVRLSTAQEPKAAQLADLRDAVKAADKRGENVSEVASALDALEAALAKGIAGGNGKEAPPELVALRDAVEAAGRKGENVGEIRSQLDLVEKAITGKSLAPPKPLPPPEEPLLPPNNGGRRPNFFPQQPFMLPEFAPGGLGINQADMQKAQELMQKGFQLRLKDPGNKEAIKMLVEAREMMLKAMAGAGGGDLVLPEGFPLLFPNDGLGLGGLGGGAVPEKFRLGVRLVALTPVVREQLDLDGAIGIAITEVIPASAADKAGFKANDIVIEFAGKPVSDLPEDFTQQVRGAKGGNKLSAVVLRKGKKVELKEIELDEVDQPRAIPNVAPGFPMRGIENPGRDGNEGRIGNSVSVSMVNGSFTIKATQDDVEYLITGGENDDGDTSPRKITIRDGDKTTKAESLKDVPEQHREKVETLLKSVRPGRINVRQR